MSASVVYPQRVAMISLHTSPLATPGVGDAGGLNVYVGEVARRLGERGLKVDVFTRAAGDDHPTIVELNEHTRVIHVSGRPGRARWPRRSCWSWSTTSVSGWTARWRTTT